MLRMLNSLSFLKGILFVVLLSTSGFCSIVLLTPVLLTVPVHSTIVIQWRRNYTAYISSLYFEYVVSLIALIGQTQVYIYSDDPSIFYQPSSNSIISSTSTSSHISPSTSSLLQYIHPPNGPMIPSATLIMSNNRSRIDYMFSGWCYAVLTNRTANLKMIVKDFYRSIPIFGWAMQCMMYIFLNSNSSSSNNGNSTLTTISKRKREADVSSITKTFNYLLNLQIAQSSRYRIGFGNKYPLSLYFFPEGTDLSKQNREKSNSFARSKQWPEMQYVLYPKSAGLAACLSCLRQWQPASGDSAVDNGRIHEKELEDEDTVIVPSFVTELSSSSSSSSSKGYNTNSDNDPGTTLPSTAPTPLHPLTPLNNASSANEGHHSAGSSASSSSTSTSNSRSISSIHDITIAYNDHTPGVRPSEWSILQGRFPKAVHLIVRTYAISELLSYDDAELQQWLKEVFVSKERLLQAFYTQQSQSSSHSAGNSTDSSGTSSSDYRGHQSVSTGSSSSTSSSSSSGGSVSSDGDSSGSSSSSSSSSGIKWPPLQLQTVNPTLLSFNNHNNNNHNDNNNHKNNVISIKDVKNHVDIINSSTTTTTTTTSTSTTGLPSVKTQSLVKLHSFLIILTWTVFCIISIIYFSWMRWLCTIMITGYIGTRLVNGLDQLELFLHYDMILHEASLVVANRMIGNEDDEHSPIF